MKDLTLDRKFSPAVENYVSQKLSIKNFSYNVFDQLTIKGEALTLLVAANKDDYNKGGIAFTINEKGEIRSQEETTRHFGKDVFLPETTSTPAATAAATAIAPVTITPNINNLILNLCNKFGEKLLVNIPANPVRKVDIYFLADTTGSMTTAINTVKAGIPNIISTISAVPNIDVAFGVGNYKDFKSNDPYCFKSDLNITAGNTPAVVAAVNTWTASGGGDTPEGQFFAFNRIADATNPIGWRNNALKILVWFGDAPAHDPICPVISGLGTPITEASVTAQLAGQQIRTLAISLITGPALGLNDNPITGAFGYGAACPAAGTPGQATRITAATGGSASTGVNPANISASIISIIQSSLSFINNVSLVPTGNIKPFICSINPKTGYSHLDASLPHTLEFVVCFRGVVACGEKDANFSGTIDVVMDSVVVAAKKVNIEVPACKSKGKCQCDCGCD